MSQPVPIQAGSPRPRSPASAPLSASRCLITSRMALPVHGVSTTRATTRSCHQHEPTGRDAEPGGHDLPLNALGRDERVRPCAITCQGHRPHIPATPPTQPSEGSPRPPPLIRSAPPSRQPLSRIAADRALGPVGQGRACGGRASARRRTTRRLPRCGATATRHGGSWESSATASTGAPGRTATHHRHRPPDLTQWPRLAPSAAQPKPSLVDIPLTAPQTDPGLRAGPKRRGQGQYSWCTGSGK